MGFAAKSPAAAVATDKILGGKTMRAIGCVILTAGACYLSFGLGNAWWLAWLAPVPVLWLAFGEIKPWKGFLAAWVAFALGMTSLMSAYAHVFPGPVLALDILGT